MTGTIDYLIAPQARVYQTPFLCVVAAKKDDFEQGPAQCLVEMYACRYCNQATKVIDVYGIVTNAMVWQFYKMDIQQQLYESPIYVETHIAEVLGVLHVIFGECVSNVGIIGQ